MRKQIVLMSILLALQACAGPTPGPDKQFVGQTEGALLGAGAGAVTGFQLGSGTGPGAAVGAGFGAVAGGINGIIKDHTEENLIALSRETQEERKRAIAQEILADQYRRRIELHPTRDIYPADLFFYGDQVKLRSCARPIIKEIAALNKTRASWSRLKVAVYTKTTDKNSDFAQYLSEERAKAIGNELANAGIEARRIDAKAIVVSAPVLVDPQDDPLRYNQAVELVAVDR